MDSAKKIGQAVGWWTLISNPALAFPAALGYAIKGVADKRQDDKWEAIIRNCEKFDAVDESSEKSPDKDWVENKYWVENCRGEGTGTTCLESTEIETWDQLKWDKECKGSEVHDRVKKPPDGYVVKVLRFGRCGEKALLRHSSTCEGKDAWKKSHRKAMEDSSACNVPDDKITYIPKPKDVVSSAGPPG